MKKFFILILSLSIIFTFSGCSNMYSDLLYKNISLTSSKNSDTTSKFILNEEAVHRNNPIQKDIKLDKTPISWWFIPNSMNKLPDINPDLKFNLKDYDAIYFGDISEKVLYLTLDEGYENGNTSKILNILKKNNVKATFFVTSPYIDDNPDLVKLMVSDGHSVGNHSMTHPSMPTLVDNISDFNKEILDTEEKFKNLTGKDINKFFRPPAGKYSEESLKLTQDLGYKTTFWSFAYKDWDINNQPNINYAKDKIISNFHNGEIILLHAVSNTNTTILESIIQEAKNQGYKFEVLQ